MDSILAETYLAGCILCDPQESLPTVRGIVQSGDFADANCRSVFRAAVDLEDNRLPVDAVTIQTRASEMGTPLSTEWLRSTMNECLTIANLSVNAEIVHRAAIDREARTVGNELALGVISAEEALQKLQTGLAGGRSALRTPAEMGKDFFALLNRISMGEENPYLPTGFTALDKVLGGGLVKSGLITVAARPSVGKSVVGMSIASNVAHSGGRVLYISLEMTETQLMARRLSARTGIGCDRLMNGIPEDAVEEWRSVGRGVTALSEEQLLIYDKGCRVGDIETKVRSSLPLDLVVVDHFGLVTPERGEENLYTSATNRVKRLQQLASSTGVPVLLLCQLNRGSESREDKRPRMSDLRDTGAVEECSDAILLLYREGYYNRTQADDRQIMEVNVAKNRHGQVGTVTLEFIPRLAMVKGFDEFRETEDESPWV